MPSLGRTAVFVISFSIVSFLAIQFTLFGFGRISAYKSRSSDAPAAAIGARTTANPAPDHSEQAPFHVLQPAQQQSAAAYKSRSSDDPAAAIGARTTPNPAPDHSEQAPFHVLQPAQQQSAAAHPSLPLPPSSPNVDTAPALEEAYVAVLDAAFSPQSSGWSHITTGIRFLRACTAHMRRLSDLRVSGSAAEGSDLRYIVCEPEKQNVGLGNRLYLDASCFLLACVTGRIALFPTARSEHDVPFTELFDTREWEFLLRDHKWQQLSAEEGPAANHVTFDFNAWFCSDLLAKLYKAGPTALKVVGNQAFGRAFFTNRVFGSQLQRLFGPDMLAGVFKFLFQPSVSTLALVRSLTQRANALDLSGSVGIQIRARGLSFNDDGTAVGSFVEVDAFIGCAVALIKAKLPSNTSSRIALHVACDNPNMFPRLEQMLAAAELTSRIAVVLPDANAVSGSGFRKSADADRHAVVDIARVAQSDVVLISSHSSYGSIMASLHSGASSRFTAGDGQICALYPNTDGSCLHAAGMFKPQEFESVVVTGGCFANVSEFQSAFKLELDSVKGAKMGIKC